MRIERRDRLIRHGVRGLDVRYLTDNRARMSSNQSVTIVSDAAAPSVRALLMETATHPP